MAKSVLSDLTFGGTSRIVDLPEPVAGHEPVRLDDLADETEVPLIAGENLGSGNFISIDAQGLAVRASASIGRVACGYTRESVLAGDPVRMRRSPFLNGFSGLQAGRTYFLSGATPGLITSTPPSSGFLQPLGVASAPDVLIVEIGPPTALVG